MDNSFAQIVLIDPYMTKSPNFFLGDWSHVKSNAAAYLDLEESQVNITFRDFADAKIKPFNKQLFDAAKNINQVLYLFVEPKPQSEQWKRQVVPSNSSILALEKRPEIDGKSSDEELISALQWLQDLAKEIVSNVDKMAVKATANEVQARKVEREVKVIVERAEEEAKQCEFKQELKGGVYRGQQMEGSWPVYGVIQYYESDVQQIGMFESSGLSKGQAWLDGIQLIGLWDNTLGSPVKGAQKGYGSERNTNGDIYYGQFDDTLKSVCHGVTYKSSGWIIKSEMYKRQPIGYMSVTFPSGEVRKIYENSDKSQRIEVKYQPDGKFIIGESMPNGWAHGLRLKQTGDKKWLYYYRYGRKVRKLHLTNQIEYPLASNRKQTSIEPIVNKKLTRKGKRGKKKQNNSNVGQLPDPKFYEQAKAMQAVLKNQKLTNTNVLTQKTATGMCWTICLLLITAVMTLYPLKVLLKF